MTTTEDDITGWRTYVSPTTGRRGFSDRYPTGTVDPDFFALLRGRFPETAAYYQPATRDEVAWARTFRAAEDAHYARHRAYCTAECPCGGWAREEAEWADRKEALARDGLTPRP